MATWPRCGSSCVARAWQSYETLLGSAASRRFRRQDEAIAAHSNGSLMNDVDIHIYTLIYTRWANAIPAQLRRACFRCKGRGDRAQDRNRRIKSGDMSTRHVATVAVRGDVSRHPGEPKQTVRPRRRENRHPIDRENRCNAAAQAIQSNREPSPTSRRWMPEGRVPVVWADSRGGGQAICTANRRRQNGVPSAGHLMPCTCTK